MYYISSFLFIRKFYSFFLSLCIQTVGLWYVMQFFKKNWNPFEPYMFTVQFEESQINDNRTTHKSVSVLNNRQRKFFPRLGGYFGVPFPEESK